MAIYVADDEAAIRFYTEVLGSPAYVEGDNTHGWRIGDAWDLRDNMDTEVDRALLLAMLTPTWISR